MVWNITHSSGGKKKKSLMKSLIMNTCMKKQNCHNYARSALWFYVFSVQWIPVKAAMPISK